MLSVALVEVVVGVGVEITLAVVAMGMAAVSTGWQQWL